MPSGWRSGCEIAEVLTDLTGATRIVKNGSGRARAAEGLPEEVTMLRGTAPEGPLDVPMTGAVYKADVMGGQKTGLFFDQRPNHAFAASLARGARVLDVFSHVGRLRAGLPRGRGGACAGGRCLRPGAGTCAGGRGRHGRRGPVRDPCRATRSTRWRRWPRRSSASTSSSATRPPSRPRKQALTQGLRAYERAARMAADLVAPGGVVILCSCSHAADLAKFRAACLRGLGRAGRDPRLIHTGFAGPDHPQHPALTETGYLKALAFRLMP
jgi:23S rRNA (cytosine1962-C5)-methyltransferase